MYRHWRMCVLAVSVAVCVNGCSSPKSPGNGLTPERLPDCPDRPNCVSSEAARPGHAVAPFRLAGDRAAGWAAVARVVDSLPRSTIVKKTDTYLHAEFRSRVFRFVDDLELLLDPATGVVAIRSASRIGYSDLGVNRRRVVTLRQKLTQNGIIQ